MYNGSSWMKNTITGEVKWFESISNVENVAARYWAFFNRYERMKNLGSSFFETKTYNCLDNSQILKQQKEYLLAVSKKINIIKGVKSDPYINITFEYLSSVFLGTPFGNNSNSGYDLSQTIWDYGGSDFIARKLPYTLVKGSVFTIDLILSSENAGYGSDTASNNRAKAVSYFMDRTKHYIDSSVLFRIKQHKF